VLFVFLENQMKRGRYILATALLLAALGAQLASAAGGYEARAHRPAYDSTRLELIGAGAYASEARHRQLKVTVCLRKKFGRRSYDVRCETTVGSGRKVKGQVSVPGCVAGAWRTTVVGEALKRNGEWVDQASAISPRFRC
jgi:hypothetical protein